MGINAYLDIERSETPSYADRFESIFEDIHLLNAEAIEKIAAYVSQH